MIRDLAYWNLLPNAPEAFAEYTREWAIVFGLLFGVVFSLAVACVLLARRKNYWKGLANALPPGPEDLLPTTEARQRRHTEMFLEIKRGIDALSTAGKHPLPEAVSVLVNAILGHIEHSRVHGLESHGAIAAAGRLLRQFQTDHMGIPETTSDETVLVGEASRPASLPHADLAPPPAPPEAPATVAECLPEGDPPATSVPDSTTP